MNANIKSFFDNEQDKETISKALNRFEYQPTFKRFAKLYNILIHGRFLFHTISIITGFFFVLTILNSFIDYIYISAVLSCIVLLLFETIKGLLLEDTFNTMYKKGTWLIIGFFAVSMLGFSVFSSLTGAKELHTKTNHKISNLQAYHGLKMDSIINVYDSKIVALETGLKDYKKSVSWKGQININNKTTKQVISNYDNRINAMIDNKTIALSKIENSNNAEIETTKQGVNFKGDLIISLATINEIIILLISWFLVFYDYSIFKEQSTINNFAPQFSFTKSNMEAILNQFVLSNINTVDTPINTPVNTVAQDTNPPAPIGFPVPSKRIDTPITTVTNGINTPEKITEIKQRIEPKDNTPINIVNNTVTPFDLTKLEHEKYLQKYSNVVNELNKGGSVRGTAKLCSVGVSTVQTVKKYMKLILTYNQ